MGDGRKKQGESEVGDPLPNFPSPVWERTRPRNQDWWNRTPTYGMECDLGELGRNRGRSAWKASRPSRHAAVSSVGGDGCCARCDGVTVRCGVGGISGKSNGQCHCERRSEPPGPAWPHEGVREQQLQEEKERECVKEKTSIYCTDFKYAIQQSARGVALV